MAKIEVEVRGKIEGDFDSIVDFFRKKAKFIEEKDRVSLTYFNRDEFVEDVRDVLDDPVDLRLRVTNKKAEIILKHGRFGGTDRRREFSIPIALDKFDEAVEMFHLLGWNIGIIFATKTFVFEYKGIEFALVHNRGIDYFEAEIMVDSENKVEKAEEKIKAVCKELELKTYTDEDFINQINKLNNLPEAKFDFNKQSFADLQKKFKEFF